MSNRKIIKGLHKELKGSMTPEKLFNKLRSECSELIFAINDCNDDSYLEDVYEEMADVKNLIERVEMQYGVKERVEQIQIAKMQRALDRIERE